MATDIDELLATERFRPPSPPPRVLLWDAVKRQVNVVLIPTLILLGVGVGIGLQRSPEYTAEARLTVGRLDVDPASLATFASATQSLASAYSRAVEARGVVDKVAASVGMSSDQVRGAISASPVPESPIIRVTATGNSSERAIALANATSGALVRYTTTLNRSATDSQQLLGRYRNAALRVSTLERRRNRLASNAGRPEALNRVEADLETARLQASTLSAAYQSNQRGAGSSKLVDELTSATGATSDRWSKLQLLALAGGLAGLLLGLAVAMLRANRLARRSFER